MAVLALLLPLAAEAPDAAEEGRKIIIAMTLVGLTFLAVILLGELARRASHRRAERRLRGG